MHHKRLIAPLAIACALFFGQAAAQAEDKLDRAAVEAIVKDYLVQHPEVIEDAMNALQERRAAAEADRQKKVVSENTDGLVNAPQNAVLGNPDGDVTLVEFFDYNCGYCKRGFADLQKLLDTDKKLKVVLRDYPILSPGSIEAASVALAVKQQLKGDKFLPFHRELLLSRGAIGKERAMEVAKDLGLDMSLIDKAVAAKETRTQLGENLKLGDSLGISGTPSYVLGTEVVAGAVGYDALKAKVDALRKCGQTVCS
jgi:protein-disulfide isomerase